MMIIKNVPADQALKKQAEKNLLFTLLNTEKRAFSFFLKNFQQDTIETDSME
jgi:hypothetical protein